MGVMYGGAIEDSQKEENRLDSEISVHQFHDALVSFAERREISLEVNFQI